MSKINPDTRKRVCYGCTVVVLIALGLLSRRVSFLPDACGDALWAMMVYCCVRILLVRSKLIVVALIALLLSFSVEFSQMLTFDWLVRFRSTFLGHMLLGQGFLWSDLLAYTIGVAIIYLITKLLSNCTPFVFDENS